MKPVFAYYFRVAVAGYLIAPIIACSQTTKKAQTSGNIPTVSASKEVDAPQKQVDKETVKIQFPAVPEFSVAVARKDTTPAKPKLGMPVLTFDAKEVHFGNIKTGDKPTFTYNITNTGDKDMNIQLVSGCDCTEIDWTKTPIKPGGKGFVKIIFHSDRAEHDDHKKLLKKDVTVILEETYPQNGYPIVESLMFDTFIID